MITRAKRGNNFQEVRRVFTVKVMDQFNQVFRTVQVTACTDYHAIQLAYARACYSQPDLSKYYV